MKRILIFLAAVLAVQANAQTARLRDDYAIAALRAVVHAQTFGTASEFDLAKEWELIDEADVQATTDTELASLDTIKNVLVGGWKTNHSASQVQSCYAALKTALRRRDGTTPKACE